jgi:outer membrane lipoprotein-sorting protein
MLHTVIKIALILLGLPLLTSAQKNDWKVSSNQNRILDNIRNSSEKIKTLKCNFTQEKVMTAFTDKMITKGLYYYQKPDKIRWEFTYPFNSVMIINRQKVTFLENNKKSSYDMGSNKLFGEISSLMSGMVQGTLFNDTKNYQVRVFENNSTYMVELKPISSSIKEYVHVIYLYFNSKDYLIEKVKLIEPSEDYSIITFTNKKLNTYLQPSLF